MPFRTESLLAQLRVYEPDDALEAAHRERMVALLAGSADPFSGQLLLHHHRRLNRWLQMGEPEHDHFDVRYLARTATPDAITIDRAESNDLAWVALDRAAELMPAAESLRAIRKIERHLTGGIG